MNSSAIWKKIQKICKFCNIKAFDQDPLSLKHFYPFILLNIKMRIETCILNVVYKRIQFCKTLERVPIFSIFEVKNFIVKKVLKKNLSCSNIIIS